MVKLATEGQMAGSSTDAAGPVSVDSRRRRHAVLLAALLLILTGSVWWHVVGSSRHPNVLLITVDTLRADFVGAYGSSSIATPHVDRLAEEGVLFENAVVPMPMTRPSHFALLSSRYPRELGVVNNLSVMPEGVPTLAESLQSAGYDTIAITAVDFLAPSAGIGRGFDWFIPPESGHQRSAEGVVVQALAWIRNQPRRDAFFAWLHFFDPHQPYDPKPPFDDYARSTPYPIVDWTLLEPAAQDGGGNISAGLLEHAKRLYGDEVRYVDHWIGTLLSGLEELGQLDNTVIVFSSDHGECFEYGYFFEHTVCLFDGALRVPLIIRYPAVARAGERVPEQVETLDIAPTILDLVGVEAPASFRGRSLFRGRAEDRLAFVEHPTFEPSSVASRSARREIIRSVAGEPMRPIHFDNGQIGVRARDMKLLVSGDELMLCPNGREGLPVVEAERQQFLIERLREWDRDHQRAPVVLDDDPLILESLRALGYLP